ncbi:GNAT family N-acetyltransferase [Dactylosporangium salmoneum]|uniref:N-acetyltransferase domain-containing protein n=1 Tax=Dactylosporangium salmoneum TaxID=53361 RepID=A0ABN3FMB8_9ACTN
MSPQLEFVADAAQFLDVTAELLAADPVACSVVASFARRAVAAREAGVAPPPGDWWLVVRDEGDAVVGAGMRTAPFEPRPPYLLPMPDEAAVALARALHARGEETLGVNGALPATVLCAQELARLGGGRVEVSRHTRLFELGELAWPAPAPGRLRHAGRDDLDVTVEWYAAFGGDADEQAGRPRGSSAHELPSRDDMLRRIEAGHVYLWVDDRDRPVHMLGATPPAFGTVRLGPVYTPPAERGNGWAGNAVAHLSHRLQAAGLRICLYTDQDNPVSNKIYIALGYRPVVDVANLLIAR